MLTKEEMKIISETARNYPFGCGWKWTSKGHCNVVYVAKEVNEDKSLIEFG